jgi:predicted deacylase
MGMTAEAAPEHPTRVPGGPWRRDSGPRASSAGVLIPRVRPGVLVARGQPVAEVRSLAGALLEEIAAETDGFVVSPTERAHIVAGVPVCTWAQIDRPRGERI